MGCVCLQTLKEDSSSSFGRTRRKQGKFPFMGRKTKPELFTIDNSFLKTPLKSGWDMPFWVVQAWNNGTSERVSLFLSMAEILSSPGSSPASVYSRREGASLG